MDDLKLYFVCCDSDAGANMDWFVIAESPKQAVDIWRRDNGVDPGCDFNPIVFLVQSFVSAKAAYAGARLLSWHQDIKEVTP